MSTACISDMELNQIMKPLSESIQERSFDAECMARSIYLEPTSSETLARYITNIT